MKAPKWHYTAARIAGTLMHGGMFVTLQVAAYKFPHWAMIAACVLGSGYSIAGIHRTWTLKEPKK